MSENKTAIWVGLFLILGIACFTFFAVWLGGNSLLRREGYNLYASFDSVSGLKHGTTVEVAGVVVGHVGKVKLNHEKMQARLQLQISDTSLALDEETVASIRTKGIIGERYVKLVPGAGERILKDGDSITETQSALELEDVIGKFLYSVGPK
ncbi:MAG: outer membrane lipid asymmetry maintenance protein MlaD [Lentisphaerae bacterium RIFOXYB12_FULL_65_16]|nr:MAG: outer membrane lipid asymmetry maintenance protein MlaD [Lentisphaerae bacterium RIFOXYB12_FULL_65_16]OGV95260.1 MAG: outer membrane lipid asymmetry maintenance protein MlaD [Lentisphaerae bacterium RIFOXYB12_FULL_65_16]